MVQTPSNDFGPTRQLSRADFDSTQSYNSKDDDLGRILSTLYAPTLNLIKHYLYAKNGSRRTMQNCVQDFSEKHPDAFTTAFVVDWIFRFIGIMLALIVFARGIGLLPF